MKKTLPPLAFGAASLLPFGLVILAFFGLWFFIKRKGNQETAAQVELETESTGLTYPVSAYAGFADQIEAGGKAALGTDEDAIFGVFMKMKTRRDVLQLVSAFGERRAEYTTGTTGLSGFLASELDSEDIAEINTILMSQNIDYAF